MQNWENVYAARTDRIKSSAIRELLKLSQQPDVISFAGGLPAAEVFPVDLIKKAVNVVLETNSDVALQYGTTEGYTPLRKVIKKSNEKYNINFDIDNIMITAGGQQALDLIGKVFINPGDKVLVEAPTYLGALQAWNTYGAEYVCIPNDEHGMMVDQLEKLLSSDIKLIYALPNFQNPTGVTLSFERRKILIELAEKYNVPIIEDDPYGRLRYEGEHLPPLYSISGQNNNEYNGNVIYMSSFSKILSPGFRLAWMIAPKDVISKLVQAKQGTDLHTGTFSQVVAYEVCKDDFLNEHIKNVCRVYNDRRNVMLDTLCEHMPDRVSWSHPEGGLFLWVKLPDEMDTEAIFPAAVDEKVAYVPGSAFFADGSGHNAMRLNFSYAQPEQINEGINRLSKVIKKYI